MRKQVSVEFFSSHITFPIFFEYTPFASSQDRASNPIIRLSLKRAKLSPGFEDRLFEKLHYDMDGMNPRIFELPIELREYFDHTWTHPSTGAYVDTSRYEVSQVSARGTRGKSGSRMNSSSNISKPSESTRARTASAQNFSLRLRDGNSDALSQQQQQPSIPLCYKCGKSGNKLYNPNFLTSTSVKKSQSSQSVSKLTSQIDRSPIIACEFCDLYWHLDCLDPPLTSPPADLNADTEIVDADQARNLKRKAWGVQLARESDRGELPSDPNQPKENLFDQEGGVAANNSGDGSVGFSGLVKIPVVGNTISTSSSAYDLQVAEDGSARTSKLGLLQIRRKWMCPCHADWVLPRQRIGRRWKWIELNENGDVVMVSLSLFCF